MKHYRDGNEILAVKYINKAIDLIPKLSEFYIVKSRIDSVDKLENINQSINLATKDEDQGLFFFEQGLYYQSHGLYSEALLSYKNALKLINNKSLINIVNKSLNNVCYILKEEKTSNSIKIDSSDCSIQSQIDNSHIESSSTDTISRSVVSVPYEYLWWLGHRNKSLELTYPASAKVIEGFKVLDGYGNPNITIAISDNGIDIYNPDINSKIRDPWDFWNNSPIFLSDPNYVNGTPLASLVVSPNNGFICGVAPVARFMPLNGVGYSAKYMNTFFNYCIEKKADVIICNWVKTDTAYKLDLEKKTIITNALQKGRNGKGCIIIYPVGDDGDEEINQFAQHPDIIAVASSTSEDLHADYSNMGENITICAPSSGGEFSLIASKASWDDGIIGEIGVNRWYDDGIEKEYLNRHFGGTSASAGIVGGICALILSANPNLTPKEIKQILIQTADKIGNPSDYDKNGYSKKYGFGRVNAAKAIQKALDIVDNKRKK